MQVRRTRDAEVAAAQVQAARCFDRDFKAQILAESAGWRWCDFTAAELAREAHEIEVGSKRKLLDVYLSTQQGIVIVARESEIRVQGGANTLLVQRAHAFSFHRKIKV